MPENEAAATNVVEALRRVMRDLPAIGKEGRAAREQGSYAYRGIEQITKAAQGLCAQHGVIFTPRVVGEPEVIGITVNGKPWTDTRLLVEYDVHGPGGVDDRIVVGPIFAIGRDNADKGANKCMTQAFKYALLQTFMIADAKDDADQASVEAEHHFLSDEESGHPYRRATFRADVTPADVERMRIPELAERLKALNLSPNGSAKVLRERLTKHLDTSVKDPAPNLGTHTADSGLPGLVFCDECRGPIPMGEDVDPGEAGIETDDGRLIHAGCAS